MAVIDDTVKEVIDGNKQRTYEKNKTYNLYSLILCVFCIKIVCDKLVILLTK